MSIKQRITRAEKALNKGRDQIIFEWVEPDENGNFPPLAPGTKVIEIKWTDGPDNEPAQAAQASAPV